MRLPPLTPAVLIARRKRFLADVRLGSGEEATAHLANPGSMLGLAAPGFEVRLADARGPGRKLPWSVKLMEALRPGGVRRFVGVEQAAGNALAVEAIEAGLVPALAGLGPIAREVRFGQGTRFDLALGGGTCFVEVKSCSLERRAGLAEFPDSVTVRGARHLGALAAAVGQGARGVMLYVVQDRAEALALAADLDPAYARAFSEATAAGVEAYAVACEVGEAAITPSRAIPVLPPSPSRA